jgi:hypothetical protein
VDRQQTQNSRQLESMSEQLTKVTSLLGVLTKDVQSLQAQQQQQQQQALTAAIDETAVLEQNAAKAKQQVEYLLAQGEIGSAVQCALAAPKTELVYFCCEVADLTAVLELHPSMFAFNDLFHLIHRLSVHVTGNTDAAQVENILNWIQGICMVMADSTGSSVDFPSSQTNEVRNVIEHAVAACGKAHTNNRRLLQMTVHLLRSLIR